MNKIHLEVSTLKLTDWKRGFIKNYCQRIDQSLGKPHDTGQ